MAGDLNRRVGSKFDDRVVGPFGEEITNEWGERLINMFETYKLKITNTFFSINISTDIHGRDPYYIKNQ